MVQGGGFEPPKLARQIYSLIPLATREPLRGIRSAFSDLAFTMSTNFLRNSATYAKHSKDKKWSWREELNPRPADYKSAALPTELRQPTNLVRKTDLNTDPLSTGGEILGKLFFERNRWTEILSFF